MSATVRAETPRHSITAINRSTTTDAEGTFAFRGLSAGRYHLDALLLGYARADAEVTVPPTGPDVQVTIVMRRTVLRLSNVVVTASPTSSALRQRISHGSRPVRAASASRLHGRNQHQRVRSGKRAEEGPRASRQAGAA